MVFPRRVPIPPNTPVKRRYVCSTGGAPSCALARQIDEGSFYKIYLTEQQTILRIAKKRSNSDLEARILESLESPYINRMIRYWKDDGYLHFEMEYCAGGTVEDRIIRGFRGSTRKIRSSDTDDAAEGVLPAAVADNGHSSSMLVDPFTDNDACAECNTSTIYTDEDSESTDAPFATEEITHPPWIISLMYQVASGLHYLHRNNIVHMDIKPANILIDKMSYKICDLNIARVGEGTVDLDGDCVFMAPEILKNKCFFASDVFSMGMVYLMLCNPGQSLPRGGEAYRMLRHNNFTGWRIDEIGRRMLEKRPHKRCTALAVKRHFGQLI